MYNKVTISGQICAGKSTLFKALQKRLEWSSFSAGQLFRDYAKAHGQSLQKAEEQNPNLTQDVDLSMQEKLKTNNNIIIEGWMAGIMADDILQVLKILLISDESIRAKRFASREGVTFDEALREIRERAENWRKKLESIYHRNDFWDPKQYSVVIDTSTLSPKQVLTKVMQALES